MLSAFRAFAKSPVAQALLGLLVLAFVFWGVKDVFRTGGLTDLVIKADSRAPITREQFKQAFDEELASESQRAGRALTADDAVKGGLDRFIVERLAASEAMGALMTQEGVYPGDTLVANELRKITGFFNPVSGQFDKEIFRRQLAARHMDEDQAYAEFRDTVAQRHYLSGLSAGLKAPKVYALLDAALEQQGVDFQWFAIPPGAVPAPAKPTDATLNDFIKQHADRLTRPETRQLSLVVISAARLAQTLPAGDADVQKQFDFEKDSLSVPEKRTVVTVAVKDAATGAKVAQELKAGGNPMTIAKAVGAQATTYSAAPKGEIVDRKVADAAFALKAGDVAGPIQGDLGLAVIKVVDVSAGKLATLADSRAKIEAEVKQRLAKQKAYDLAQKYNDARAGGEPMANAAKTAGVDIVSLPTAIAANGGTLEGQRVNMPPKLLEKAFTLAPGGESDLVQVGPGEYWSVRLDKVIPSALLGLDEPLRPGMKVRDLVTQAYMSNSLQKALRDKADGLVGEIKKGKAFEAAAAEVGAKVEEAKAVTRAAARPTAPNQPPAYSPELLGRLFDAKPGDTAIGGDARLGIVVGKLERMQEPAAPILAGLAEAEREQTTRALFNDLGEAATLAARKKVKTIVDMKQAHQAMGIADDTAAAGGARP